MTKKEETIDTNWFVDLLMSFAPPNVTDSGQSPEELTSTASWKAFGLSTAAALPPGPIGLVTIVPELIAVTKIQMNLIYSIAAHHGKQGKLNSTLIVMIFANEAGLAVGRQLLKKTGTKVIVRALGSKAVRPIAQKVAARIGTRITQKFVGRWIPVLLAPVFGAFSKSMTTKIGREADKLLSQDFEMIETAECPNGHEMPNDSKFCPECGVSMTKG